MLCNFYFIDSWIKITNIEIILIIWRFSYIPRIVHSLCLDIKPFNVFDYIRFVLPIQIRMKYFNELYIKVLFISKKLAGLLDSSYKYGKIPVGEDVLDT